ncbi:hypothetical protein niasHT_024900 [Heterodera trifolii]|uniref:Uncharacterized protein n=1 Tax=Heterodera trifolii TaxID=157864 RepID=A0ABD2JZA6_9BILA
MEKELLATMKTKGREQLRKDIGGMFDQLQNVVGEEVAGLWAKIEPLLTEQARAHGVLAEAFDEFVANFSAEKEKSPEPQPENEENEVPVAEGAENGENEENQGMMPQARGRGQFRAGVKNHPKNVLDARGTERRQIVSVGAAVEREVGMGAEADVEAAAQAMGSGCVVDVARMDMVVSNTWDPRTVDGRHKNCRRHFWKRGRK